MLNATCKIGFNFFSIYLYFFEQKIYSHQVLIYLNVPGIPVRKPLQNRQIVEEQLDVWVLGVICASLLTGRHLLMNKKDKNSRYTSIKIMIIWRNLLPTLHLRIIHLVRMQNFLKDWHFLLSVMHTYGQIFWKCEHVCVSGLRSISVRKTLLTH